MPKKNTTTTTAKTGSSQGLNLEELSTAYLNYLKEQGKTEKTLYTYGKDLNEVKNFFGPEKSLSALRPADFGRFLKSDGLLKLKNGTEKSPITIKKTIRVIRMMLVWAVDSGHLPKLPLPKDFPMGRDGKDKEEAQGEE